LNKVVGRYQKTSQALDQWVLRHRQHDDGSLYGALRYAWRREDYETDVQLWAACDDLGRLQGAIADIDEFARAITVIPRGELRRG
jgi:hypothetical protein